MAGVETKKFGRSSMMGMAIHFENALRAIAEHSNQDIDKALTALNYYIGAPSYQAMIDEIERQIALADKEHPPIRLKKDRKVFFSLYISCPPELEGTDKEDEFYQKAYETSDEVIQKLTGSHLAGACIHKDEKHEYYDSSKKEIVTSRNHMHAFAAAIAKDGRCNCKATINKEFCQTINNEIQKMCLKEFGISYQTGLGRQGAKRTVEQCKTQSLIAQKRAEYASLAKMQEYDDKVESLSSRLGDMRKEKEDLLYELSNLQDELASMKKDLEKEILLKLEKEKALEALRNDYNELNRDYSDILFYYQSLEEAFQNRINKFLLTLAKEIANGIVRGEDALKLKEKAEREANAIVKEYSDYQQKLKAKVEYRASHKHRNNDYDFERE